jgi:outer membrane murein-binding lipoprotein Lpp
MSDDTAAGSQDAAGSGRAGGSAGQEVIDDLGAAMARLRAAIDRLREEVEANAQTEWVRAKPELHSTIADLQAMVDTLAQRVKSALGDLGTRLEGQDKRDRG